MSTDENITLQFHFLAGELDDIEVSEEVTDGFRNPIDSVEAIDSSTSMYHNRQIPIFNFEYFFR